MSTNSPTSTQAKPRFATIWLGGCSGCHMSFLDMDDHLFDLAELGDLVFSPLIDVKEFPANVDATLIEGAVANVDNLELLKKARECSKVLIAFGDCAVTGNVTAMRNPLGSALPVLKRSYLDERALHPQYPRELPMVPPLLDKVVPIHHVVSVDYFLPGCPPHPNLIFQVMQDVLSGRVPNLLGKFHYG